MSTRERSTHQRITGHTGPEGGALEAHAEPGMGTPGQYEGPLDGRLSGYAESLGDGHGDAPEVPDRSYGRSAHKRMTPGAQPIVPSDGRSMVDLLRQLSTDSSNLVRQEMELAKAEMREKIGVFQRSMVSIGIGSAMLLAAFLTGVWALNTGLTALFAQFIALDVAVWLSPLILTGALAGIGWALIKGAGARMAHEGLVPRRTTTTLREDSRWARAKVQEIKEEISHGR